MKSVKVEEIEKARKQAEDLIKDVINSYQSQFGMELVNLELYNNGDIEISEVKFDDLYRGEKFIQNGKN